MISIENVSKQYGNTKVLHNIDLKIKDGELLVLLGTSGCGKTTLLRMINRLIPLSDGDIKINGKSIKDYNEIQLRREIGYVIQSIGLFPHLTVKENIEIIGRINKVDKETLDENTRRVLTMVNMSYDEFAYRYPFELSGGQSQRIGVARAYATDPGIILMDEPFSALDPITRLDLQNQLISIQKNTPKTIIFVTHDINEAIRIADRIVLFADNGIAQVGTPRKLLLEPASVFVKSFFGDKRIWNTPWLIHCADIMSKKTSSLTLDATVSDAIELMKIDQVQTLLVLDNDGRVAGKLTEKMLLRHANDILVMEAMKKEYDYAYGDTPLYNAVEIMNKKNILYLPIIDKERRPLGMINLTDLMVIFEEQVLSSGNEVKQ